MSFVTVAMLLFGGFLVVFPEPSTTIFGIVLIFIALGAEDAAPTTG